MKSLSALTLVLPLLFSLSCSSSGDSSQPELPISDAAFIPKADGARPSNATNEAAIADAVAEAPREVISLEAKTFDCAQLADNACNPDEPSNAFRCSLVQNNNLLIADDQQIHGRGDSRCFAKSALESKLCSEKVILNGGIIECHPDNAPIDECSAPPENCAAAPQELTKCFSKEIESSEVSWTHRPEAWGKSECEARNNLRKRACDRGLAPTAMTTITCEKETSPVVCPPIQQNCLVQGNELIECRIRKIGDVPLREALKGMGSTTCEATYRVKDLACRWQRKEISELNDVECRSVSKGETFSTSAKAKTYKKVKRL